MSHSSWFVYAGTNRIFKHYNFNTRDAATSSNAMSFSSYPGFLESLDDYYMMNNDIVLIQVRKRAASRGGMGARLRREKKPIVRVSLFARCDFPFHFPTPHLVHICIW